MFGFLNVAKPRGMTSREAVDAVKRVLRGLSHSNNLRPTKIGHAGTLDPLAEGVLVVAIGPATRLIPYVQRLRKKYDAEFHLGVTSDSFDTETEMIPSEFDRSPTREQVVEAMARFTGTFDQVPPAYSAAKVKGRRAYRLARQGKSVVLEPKKVQVHCFELMEYQFPKLTATIECGSGTYIRSLGRDLGEQLGCGAVMTGLERTAVGDFQIGEAILPDQISADNLAQQLCPPQAALNEVRSVVLDDELISKVRHCVPIQLDSEDELMVGLDRYGRLLALLKKSAKGFHPCINFVGYYDEGALEQPQQ